MARIGRRSGATGALAFALAVALAGAGRAHAADGGSPAGEAAATGDAQAPTVAASVDRTEAHVGDPITLTVTAVSRRGVPVNLPNVVELAPFSLLARSENDTDLGDGHVRRQFILQVAAYEPGTPSIPAVEVTYLGAGGAVRQVRTQPIEVKIASLIANEPEPALREDAAPVAVWKRDLTLVYVAGGVLAAAIGALVTYLIVRRLRSRVVVRPGPPPRPAHEVALERLDRLGAYGFLENADNRPFYFAVSEVIRDYLGGRYQFDSLELTTDELMTALERRTGALPVLTEIKVWLSSADLVKFAKVSPTAAEARGALEVAIRIVETTRPRGEGTAAAPAPAPAGATAHG